MGPIITDPLVAALLDHLGVRLDSDPMARSTQIAASLTAVLRAARSAAAERSHREAARMRLATALAAADGAR